MNLEFLQNESGGYFPSNYLQDQIILVEMILSTTLVKWGIKPMYANVRLPLFPIVYKIPVKANILLTVAVTTSDLKKHLLGWITNENC